MASEQVLARLNSLQDTASRESIQTVAKYILMKRKQAKAICATFLKELQNNCRTNGSQKVMLYISVLDEMLITDETVLPKWQRNADFRDAVGEEILLSFFQSKADWKFLVALQVRGDNTSSNISFREKMQTLCQKWDTMKCFSKDSILPEMQRLLDSMIDDDGEQDQNDDDAAAADANEKEKEKENVPMPTKDEASNLESSQPGIASLETEKEMQQELSTIQTPNETPPSGSNYTNKDVIMTDITTADNSIDNQTTPKITTEITNTKPKVEPLSTTPAFKFPDTDKPVIKVQPSDFLEPCKSIATMQIAREIRNDTASQLWTVLQSIPKEVEDFAKTVRNGQNVQNESKDENVEQSDPNEFFTENNYPLTDELLDIDIAGALSEVQQFRDVVLRQRQARKKCIDLLIDSQCQFGSMDAAQAFEDFGNMMHQVKKRRLLLSDAMELEGLDFVEDGGDGADMTGSGANGSGDGEKDNLEPFPWFENKNKA